MKNYIFGYTEQNPLLVHNYPYGFTLRTDIRYWIESVAGKGDRFCSQTLNPKNNQWNKPKKSTYHPVGVMFKNEIEHVKFTALNIYSKKEFIETFLSEIGGVEKLNPLQQVMLGKIFKMSEALV